MIKQHEIEFKNAIENGDIEKIKLLFSLNSINSSNMNIENGNALTYACLYGNLKIVKYLLNSPDFKECINIHAENDSALAAACQRGHLDIVKYLLSSPDLEDHADRNADNNFGLNLASGNNHLEIVKYLLTLSKTNKDDMSVTTEAFINACCNNRIDIIAYYIFDYQIEMTKEIELFLKNKDKKDIIIMFAKRTLEQKLDTKMYSYSNVGSRKI